MGRKMRRCSCCGCYFCPDPRVQNQHYCGKKRCQQARKNKWQRQKIIIDHDYRADKKDSQDAWLDKNPNYWKRYRRRNLDYAERNRQMQRERDAKRRLASGKHLGADLAKKDALISFFDQDTTSYFLLPEGNNLAKKDAIMVKIVPISPG